MEFRPIKEGENLIKNPRVYRKNIKILEGFLDLNMEGVEVIPTDSTPTIALYNGLRIAIVRRNFPIKVQLNAGKIYLLRTDYATNKPL